MLIPAPPRPPAEKIFLVWNLNVWGPLPWGSLLPTLLPGVGVGWLFWSTLEAQQWWPGAGPWNICSMWLGAVCCSHYDAPSCAHSRCSVHPCCLDAWILHGDGDRLMAGRGPGGRGLRV